MLSEYFGLVMDPFESGPDPRFLYMDAARRNAFAQLLSSVYECKGTVLLAGDRGLGKSTLIRHLADQLAALDSVLVLYPGGVLSCRPGMSFPSILEACRGRFDRRDKTDSDENRLTATLERMAGQSQVAVLLLDDADTLDDVTLARLGQLSETDSEGRRLISVILVGSPALAERLESVGGPDASVDLLVDLPPLRDRDVDRLIRHRLSVAGHDGDELFSPVAIAEIARRSRGNAMRINAMCSASLALAEREMKSTVSRELVDRSADQIADDAIASTAPTELPHEDVEGGAREHEAERGGAEPAEFAALSLEPRPVRTGKRLDDVAEAIRAADMRSTGGADPHIKYGHFSSAPSMSETAARGRPDPLESRATPVDDGYRVYPGARPSGTPPRARRGAGLVKAALIGIVLAALAGGGTYVVRSGLIGIDGIAERIGALTDKVVRTVEGVIAPDSAFDDDIAAGRSPSSGVAQDTDSTDLSFERFGAAKQDRPPADATPYAYAPPPPHGGLEPPEEAPPPAAVAAKPDAVPAPPPVVAPPAAVAETVPSPTPQQPQQPQQPEQNSASAGTPPPAPDPRGAKSEDFDLLDPATAVILSRQGPQPAPKPAPPSPPANANPAAPPAPSVTVKRAEPVVEAAPKPEPERAQVQPLLTRGDEYLGSGDLDMARTFYQMAYDRGSAEAAIRMGWTFDPQYFQRIGLRGEASPREAILWYQEALRRGSRQASGRLSDLATWLQNAASSGDVEAQRILKLWQG